MSGACSERTDMRTCTLCQETKPLAAFHKHGLSPNGAPKHRGQCAECRSEAKSGRHKRSLYGLQPDEIELMRVEQGGLCAACHLDPGYPLVIDHCHKTGRVRALLC